MLDNLTFTPVPDLSLVLELDNSLKDCNVPFLFTNKFGIASHYTNHELPPGYAIFMRLGPKTKAGDWGDLALRNPIAMFMLGKAFFVPLCGICYCVLLYKGQCGYSVYSSERPFQRYWRITLYIILITTIMYSLMGLSSAILGIMTLMTETVSRVPLPSLNQLIDNSISQNNHIFEKNKAEVIAVSKAIITAKMNEYNEDVRKEEPQTRKIIKKLEKFVVMLEHYNKSQIELSDKNYVDLVFLRDIHREWLRLYVDHLTFTTIQHNLQDVPLGDIPTYFLNPRVIFDYYEAVAHITNLSSIVKTRIEEITETYNTTLDGALKILESYSENLVQEVINYYNSLSDYGTKLNEELETNKHERGTKKENEEVIEVPASVLAICFWICLMISFLLLNFLLGVIVGWLGERSSRKLFGMNKRTGAIILRT